MAGQSAILDMLFDKSEGILKEEVPEIQTLDFVSLSGIVIHWPGNRTGYRCLHFVS
jgi:hypothetical protein